MKLLYLLFPVIRNQQSLPLVQKRVPVSSLLFKCHRPRPENALDCIRPWNKWIWRGDIRKRSSLIFTPSVFPKRNPFEVHVLRCILHPYIGFKCGNTCKPLVAAPDPTADTVLDWCMPDQRCLIKIYSLFICKLQTRPVPCCPCPLFIICGDTDLKCYFVKADDCASASS